MNDITLTEEGVQDILHIAEQDSAREILSLWRRVQDELRSGLDEIPSHHDCVYNGRDAAVYVDEDGNVLHDVLDHLGVEDAVMSDYMNELMHEVARDVCNYDWGAVYPLVINKRGSHGILLGERHTEDRLVDIIQRADGAASALDYYMTEERGLSQSQWAEIRDVPQQTVSQNVGNAK